MAQQIVKEPVEKVIHGNTKPTFTRDDLKRSLPVVVGVGVVLTLVVWVVVSMYIQLNPPVNKYREPSPLDGISVNDTNYTEMTKQQIDLQLKRQVGVSVVSIQDKTLTKSMLGDYEKASKIAAALFAYGKEKKGLEAYAVIEKSWKDQLDYNFYMGYAYKALDQKDSKLALEQLALAKPKIDAIISPESKEEARSSYGLMMARAEDGE